MYHSWLDSVCRHRFYDIIFKFISRKDTVGLVSHLQGPKLVQHLEPFLR